MYTWYIITVVEVRAFGIHSLYPDFRVWQSYDKVSPIAIYYRKF